MNDIFSIASGFPVFGPNAAFAKRRLRNIIRVVCGDYLEVESPAVAPARLFQESGHMENYIQNMFPVGEKLAKGFSSGADLYLKPMNCPYHIAVFQQENHSYRELPYRIMEFGKVFRNERDAVSQFRYNQFEQDDGHVFVDALKVDEEISRMLDLFLSVYKQFNLDVSVELSLRGDKRIGSDLSWNVAEDCLRSYLRAKNAPFVEKAGEAAFYGPKIDFKVNDEQGRSWQLGTIQLDFFLCERFGVEYVDENNERQRPVLIHRAIYGSLERFMQILENLNKVPDELCRNLVYWIPMRAEHYGEVLKYQDFQQRANRNPHYFEQNRIDQNYDAMLVERIKNARLKGFRKYVIYGQKEIESGAPNFQLVKQKD